MSIRVVIIAINQMEADGVIDRYAIGGGVVRRSIWNRWRRWTWTSS